jgi:hypothetical protein
MGGLRLPAGKLAGILTYFQRKVNTKFSLLRLPEAPRRFKTIYKTLLTFTLCYTKLITKSGVYYYTGLKLI